VSSCGEQFDDLLDRFVGPGICDFKSAVWAMLEIRAMMEAAVGDGVRTVVYGRIETA
jgi:hypothetical protein